jgi:S1-C subfamily serine protease
VRSVIIVIIIIIITIITITTTIPTTILLTPPLPPSQVVVDVLEDSPAEEGGLRTLDILLEIQHRPIYNVEDAQRVIREAGVGRDLEIKVRIIRY